MLRNFFTTAWRNLVKNKGYSAINIVGLATGMAVALMIGLWIWDELSFDHYHVNHDRLAEVMTTQKFNGEKQTYSAIAAPLGVELRTRWGNLFKNVTLASWNDDHILAVGEKKISKPGMAVQPEFPGMVTLKMLSGSREALRDPSSILLNESMALALFGKEDPLNKTVKVDNKTVLKVAGVFEDLPRNTTFYETHFLTSWDNYQRTEAWMKDIYTQWGNHSFQLFVEMNPHVDFAKASASIKDIPKQHNKDGEEEAILHPMNNWHLHSEFKNGKPSAGGRIQFVWLFGIIGVFVLLLACINFMNLSTARSEKRAKEVGIRKTLGSLRRQLVGQLLSESVLVALLAFIVSLLMVSASLPFFNSLSDKVMFVPWGNGWFWLLTLGFTLFTGLISGSYPAFYLSSFEPIKVLKGTFKVGRFASLPRKILVVIQFTVSITLIIGTVIVFRQIQYAKDRPVGYSREGLLTVSINTPEIYGHYSSLREDLLQTDVVENMAESNSSPTEVTSNQIGFDWKGKDPSSVPLFGIVAVTHDYGPTMGWSIKEGRDYSRSFPTDTGGFVLNESAVKLTGLIHPVGQMIKWNGSDHKVIGVVHDMVMESPYMPIAPTIYYLDYGWTQDIIVRIKPTVPVREALAQIEPVFKKYNPGSPFEYHFTDEEYARKFSDEQRIGNLAAIFAILAIFISCLGLFGLASFVAEQRTKEMGVRKVLGASIFSIWQLLSKEFVLLVIISCLISTPIAWYYLYQWLQNYKYHTGISWWIFLLAAIGALTITLITVSFQAIKAALANPVKSLRTE